MFPGITPSTEIKLLSIDNGVVVLQAGQPAAIRISAFKDVTRQRKDPDTGFLSDINILSMQVTELNGKPVLTIYEVTAEKLAAQFRPYLAEPTFSSKLYTITKTGSGYLTNYTLVVT